MASETSSARDLSKAQSRTRLIEAAADSIYRHGIRGTTIGEIQAISGLSRGMINLHFKSKENLLLAVAQSLSERYDLHLGRAIAGAGGSAQAQLVALFRADLDPVVLSARDVSIWFALRAEVHANPAFRPYISTRSGIVHERLTAICAALTPAPCNPPDAPRLAAHALLSLLEGIWNDFHMSPESFDADEALQVCQFTARKFFADFA